MQAFVTISSGIIIATSKRGEKHDVMEKLDKNLIELIGQKVLMKIQDKERCECT